MWSRMEILAPYQGIELLDADGIELEKKVIKTGCIIPVLNDGVWNLRLYSIMKYNKQGLPNIGKFGFLATMGVLPGEVRFDCARPEFYPFWDVGQLATWLTRLVSKTQNPKPQISNPET